MTYHLVELTKAMIPLMGKPGGIKFNAGMIEHQIDSDFEGDEAQDILIIGEPGVPIEKEHMMEFLDKLDKYVTHDKFDNGRTYFYEGISELEDGSFAICWGS